MTMDLDQAIRTLEDLRRNDPVIQRGRNAELTTAFKVFWDSNPDEAKFCRLTAGLLITPAILYHMVTHPLPTAKHSADVPPLPQEQKPEPTTTEAPVAPATKKGGKNAASK
ncbi:MAG: hypothetical protein ABFC78_09775 [Methanoregula sp.]|jgi:hypothetical protein